MWTHPSNEDASESNTTVAALEAERKSFKDGGRQAAILGEDQDPSDFEAEELYRAPRARDELELQPLLRASFVRARRIPSPR